MNSRQIAADIEGKLANQGEVLCEGISCVYLSLSNKWKPCQGAINSWPSNLKTALEKYIQFQCNCEQTTGWSKEQYCKLWDLFPNFLWNYTYNFKTISRSMDRIPIKIKWKIHAFSTLYFKFWRYFLQKFVQYSHELDLLILVVFINFYISRYHSSEIFRTSFNITLKKRFSSQIFLF